MGIDQGPVSWKPTVPVKGDDISVNMSEKRYLTQHFRYLINQITRGFQSGVCSYYERKYRVVKWQSANRLEINTGLINGRWKQAR